jgi:hypothetical protein
MAAHVSSQNAPDLLIPEATRRSSPSYADHEVDSATTVTWGAQVTTSGTDRGTLCPRREGSGRASPHARIRGVLDGHRGHAAGAVHTVPEHHAS